MKSLGVALLSIPKSFVLSTRDNYNLPKNTIENLPVAAEGTEVIIPVNVHDIDYRNNNDNTTTRYQSTDAQFFHLINNYVQKFQNVHEKATYVNNGLNPEGFKYEAHYVGRDTEYFTGQTDANTKGWNIIVTNGGMHISWEGDPLACAALDDRDSVCTADKAREYCHRHGGELFFPDEYYFNFFFKPMCSKDDNNVRRHANRWFGATYSNANYWLNLRRVEEPQSSRRARIASIGQHGGDHENHHHDRKKRSHMSAEEIERKREAIIQAGTKLGVQTTSSFHFFDRFSKNNRYTGWADDFSLDDSTVYEYVLGTLDDANNWFILSQFKEPINHQRLGTVHRLDLVNDQGVSLKEDMQAYAEYVNKEIADGTMTDLNLAYISDHFQSGGFLSQDTVFEIVRI